MSTYPLPTLAAQITATGISAPSLQDIIASEIATEQSIFGSDIVLTPDTQDGQRLNIRCAAYNDLNNLAKAVYQSFLAAYAQGVGLSALVQMIGENRKIATNSTVNITLSGVYGTPIQSGVAVDNNNNLWNLPDEVTIPISGAITVAATAQAEGVLPVPTSMQPWTIITGWQSVTAVSGFAAGAPVETDAALRQRVFGSSALGATTPLNSIVSAIANLAGVGRIAPYENQANAPDGNGIPGHSIALVVEGGNSGQIAQTIEQKKAPGTGTYGSLTQIVTDPSGLPVAISYYPLTEIPICVAVTVQPLQGWASTTSTAITTAIVAFLNSLPIGQDVYLNWVIGAASLLNSPLGQTFTITALAIGLSPETVSAANVTIAFNQAAQGVAADIVVSVL